MRNDGIHIQMYDYDRLTQETIVNSIKLIDYFRLNLIYYELISGKGLEFDRIKDYVVGDDPRRIDWKIFARTGSLKVRKFKEERKFDIILVVDVSNSMLLGTTDKTKNEFAAIVAGTLAFAAVEAGDNVAVVLASDEHMIATNPAGDFFDVLSVVSDSANYGGNKDWDAVITTLIGWYNSDAIIFLISDFIDTDVDTFLPILASNFTKVYGVMIRDPVDNELPENVGRMFFRGIDSSKNYLTDLNKVRKEYNLLAKRDIETLRSKFHEYGTLFFHVVTGEDFATGFVKALGEEKVEIS